MIVVAATVKAKEGKRCEFIEVARKCVTATRLEEGNRGYSLYVSPDDEVTLFFLEKYVDKDAFKAHVKEKHFAEFSEAIKDIKDGDFEIERFETKEK